MNTGAAVAYSDVNLRRMCWWTLVLSMAWLLKYHYSVAAPIELQWILRPLAWLTEAASGLPFSIDDSGEWVNKEYDIVIAKSCAGVNFMILSFIICAWRLYPHRPPQYPVVYYIGLVFLCLSGAWFTNVMVNTLRIIISIHLYLHEIEFPGLTAGQSHRLTGIIIFLPALWFQLRIASTMDTMRAGMIAILLYIGIAAGVPLITGNYQANSQLYMEQLWFIVVTTVIFYLLLLLVTTKESIISRFRILLSSIFSSDMSPGPG